MDGLDFFNCYMMASVQLLIGFYSYAKFLKKEIKPLYALLRAGLGTIVLNIAENGAAVGLGLFILMLAADGLFLLKIYNASVLLYAVITAQTMQFMFGIVHSALCLLFPFAGSGEMAGVFFMTLGYLALPATIVCYYLINKCFPYDEKIGMSSKYAVLILMPVLLIFFVGEYIRSAIYGNTIVTDAGGAILNANHTKMLAIQILGMASLFCVLFSYQKLSENFRLHTKLSLLEQEEHYLSQYVAEAKSRYEETKSFRHDSKNHIAVLNRLLREGKMDQAANYLKDMDEMANALSFPCSTNHPVADILVGSKLGMAKSMGADVSCTLTIPYPCEVREIDFASILSNALDNAIYACKSMDADSEKYICVSGKMQGDFLLIEVENNCRKVGGFQKGTGLQNIQSVAEKYHGAVQIKAEDTRFILSVLLVIPQRSESISQQTAQASSRIAEEEDRGCL